MADAAKSANSGTQLQVNGTEISVSPDFKKVVLNGVTVETANGRLVITTPDGTVISKPAAANDTAVAAGKAALEVGDKMEDGTIFAGISPNTNQPMYALPADASLTRTFNEAKEYAATAVDAKGNKGFRVPTKEELNVLFQNREKGALKGTFNLTGSYSDGWYWSSTSYTDDGAWCQRLSDGRQYGTNRNHLLSVRCVR